MEITQNLKYRLLCLIVKLLGLLPFWFSDFCSRLIGLLWFKIDTRHRKITLENLARAYGTKWSKTRQVITAKQVFKNIASMIFEIAWVMGLNQERLSSYLSINGIENLTSAQSKGKGIIGLTCHMGNFEMFPRLLAKTSTMTQTNMNCYGVYRKMDSPVIEEFMLKSRQKSGTTMIPLRNASERIKVALNEGGLVGTLLDQNSDWYKGVFTNFFGCPACTNNGLAKLALDSKASVVPGYTIRKNRKFIMEFLPEISVENTGDRIRDIEVNTQKFTTAIETMIKKYPEQYFWVHNRWKTKPFCEYPPKGK